jgi:hypothetical protein
VVGRLLGGDQRGVAYRGDEVVGSGRH